MAASPTYSVEHSDEHGLIEYTTKKAEAFIGFRKTEHNEPVISFWKGGFYQGSLNTETHRLFYGNDEVDFSVEVTEEFVQEVQAKVIDE